jgi:hypothetical protein
LLVTFREIKKLEILWLILAGQPRLAETRLAECPFGRNSFGRIDPTDRKMAENFTKID